MAAYGRSNTEQVRKLLQEAVVKCSERCLYQSAKWYTQTLFFREYDWV